MEDKNEAQPFIYALKCAAECLSLQQLANVTNLWASLRDQVGSTWACSFSSYCELSASPFLFSRWMAVLLSVNDVRSSCRSPVSLMVRDRCGLQFVLALSYFTPAVLLNYCPSLPITTSGPISEADKESLYFMSLIVIQLLWLTFDPYSARYCAGLCG